MRRRSFLGLGAALLPLGLVPLRLLAAPDEEHFFVFVFCSGGWDQTRVFAPVFSDRFDMEEAAQPLSIGGIDFVDHPSRPAVPRFFTDHASRTCLLNGLEVRSVSHTACTHRIFSGRQPEDWASQIAAARSGLLMPQILVGGPGFTQTLTSKVVRVGETGQLGPLLDGSAVQASTVPTAGLSSASQGLVDAYVREGSTGGMQDRLQEIEWLLAEELPVSGNTLAPLVERLALPMTAFEQGLSRVASIDFMGEFGRGWDQHTDIEVQNVHFELLFTQLGDLMEDLDKRGLSERTTVVVFSEMGREPTPNSNGGKDHWTYTSAMFLGARVAGGQTLGGWDEDCIGLPIDPSTGGPGELKMASLDFGATVLALAGLDPPAGSVPVTAVLEQG